MSFDSGRNDDRFRPRRRRHRAGHYDDAGPMELSAQRHGRRRPRGRILGVCAWIAEYFDVETWVVRVIAVTGLIFMPSVVLPAYIIGGIVIRVHEHRLRELEWQTGTAPAGGAPRNVLPADQMPGAALREAEAQMRQMELKLRRMEAHVTSGHYELQREFNRLDR
jgi:phage shock protein C